uniref:G_PROTEIN_RECEP_F1_2 domain-containing protein n=1 Tax=Rhabditophanes sp. KR3021 TaxID=114890 RepID=A0AC35TVP5_9BILA
MQLFQFNLLPSLLEEKYSCSKMTYEEWKAEGRSNSILGTTYFSLGIFFITLYLPILMVLSKKELLQHSCYKLLLYLCCVDCVTLTINGTVTGYLTYHGDVYCTHEKLIYISGIIGMTGWCDACYLCLILALNRSLDVYDQNWANYFFEGKKTILWIISSAIYDFIQKNYPCDGMTQSEWRAEGDPNLILGIAYIIVDLLKNSNYKLILFLACIDVLALIPAGLITGWLTIEGDVYCSKPYFILCTGTFGLCGWNISCFLCLVLGFNRCLDICLPKVWNYLFEGRKMLVWLFASILYGVKMSFFAPALLYTSKKSGAWFYNPYYQITVKDFTKGIVYTNYAEVINNIVVVVGLLSMYAVFLGTLFCKFKRSQNSYKLSSSQKSLLIQAILLCTMTMASSLIYIVMNTFIVNEALIVSGQMGWIMSHGCGSFSLSLSANCLVLMPNLFIVPVMHFELLAIPLFVNERLGQIALVGYYAGYFTRFVLAVNRYSANTEIHVCEKIWLTTRDTNNKFAQS